MNIVQFSDQFSLVLAVAFVSDAKDVFVDTLTVQIQLGIVVDVVLDLIQDTLKRGILAPVVKQVGFVSAEVRLKIVGTKLFGVVPKRTFCRRHSIKVKIFSTQCVDRIENLSLMSVTRSLSRTGV